MSSFNKVQVRRPSKNWFNLGHDVKMSLEMGKLVPFLVQEAIPGDKFKLRAETLIRFAPLMAPVMHNINVHMHYFFVPNRILWDNWEDFMSPPKSDSVAPAAPFFAFGSGVNVGSLADYLGLPVSTAPAYGNEPVSSFPFAAYQKIWNDYYRDQNLEDEFPHVLNNGQSNGSAGVKRDAYNTLRTRAWQHDYFTSALPFAQKGEAVNIPIESTGYAPVVMTGLPTSTGSFDTYSGSAGSGTPFGANTRVNPAARIAQSPSIPGISDGSLVANLGDSNMVQSGTINDLRRAMRLQEWLEKQARGGSRYIEQIYMHFAVKSSDARLQRPEFIGGTRNPVIISEVLQTSESADTPQANMAGHAISGNTGRSFSYFAEEHGYIIGIMSVTPKTAYQQGIPRHFSRMDKLDYAWPTFAHIGEQEILNKELYIANDGKNDDVFGYIPRYDEYRHTPSRVAGEFRDTLAYWHLGRIFENRPALNAEFINCVPRKDIFAVPGDAQHLWSHVFNSVKVNRSLPKYGTPML